MFWVLLNSVVVISVIGKACKFLLSFCNFLFFNRSKKMESMKKLDHKRPFFFKTHARKFLGILACSQTIYFFFRHRCTESHFSLLDFYLRLSGFQALLQVIHFLYCGVRIPLILRSSLALNLSDVALYYFSSSVRRSFCLYDSWPGPVIFKAREYSAATKL